MAMSNHATRGTASARPRRVATSAVHGLQGLLMGTADVIPGVSGGTVALILGIYERLIDSIHEVASCLASLLRGDRAGAMRSWRRADFGLLIPLGVGIVLALGIGSVVLPPLIEHYPVVTSSVFFGLIAGAAVAFVLAGLTPATVDEPALLLVFAAATVAIWAMILPGVSGAYLLLIMGMYEPTLQALSDLDIAYVSVFVLGAATGLGLFSKLLAWLLDVHQDATMAVLVGLMAGSLRRLWPWQDEAGTLHAPADGGEIMLALVCVAAGLAAVTALTAIGDRSAPSADDRGGVTA